MIYLTKKKNKSYDDKLNLILKKNKIIYYTIHNIHKTKILERNNYFEYNSLI